MVIRSVLDVFSILLLLAPLFFSLVVPFSSCHTALVLESSSTSTSPGIKIGPASGISAYLSLPDMIALFAGIL